MSNLHKALTAIPMDYAIWEMLSERVYAGRKHKFTEPELIQKILKVWPENNLTKTWASIYLFRKRDSSVLSNRT